jgi:hypothetical protein
MKRIDRDHVKKAVVVPAKVAKTKAKETRANFHVRWDEALFLGIVDVTILPWAHDLWHLMGHGITAVMHIHF